ncbi:MAG TPA: methyltransferase domain-containing protein [Stellaceae bacterium]|jgi:SAM-dependent methyltransferase|nr:methyltransferase domain-containing protein [Stellaceae bacterium]
MDFCVVDRARPDLGGNLRGGDSCSFTPTLWRYLIDRFGVRSVLDVGCGEGHAVAFFNRQGVYAHGIDGLPLNVERAVFPIALHDLKAGPYTMPVDLVLCVEVVEHIEECYLESLIKTLSNGRIIAMTHCLPGVDGGHHHVNLQPKEYWVKHVQQMGYTLATDNDLYRTIAHAETGPKYFSESGLVFIRDTAP